MSADKDSGASTGIGGYWIYCSECGPLHGPFDSAEKAAAFLVAHPHGYEHDRVPHSNKYGLGVKP